MRLHKPGWHGLLLAEAVWDEHQPLLLGYKPVGHVAVHTECYAVTSRDDTIQVFMYLKISKHKKDTGKVQREI